MAFTPQNFPVAEVDRSTSHRIGIILMAKAGYDPGQALALWQRFEVTEQQNPAEFLSTHPNPGTRREDLRVWLPEAQSYFEAAHTAPLQELPSVDVRSFSGYERFGAERRN